MATIAMPRPVRPTKGPSRNIKTPLSSSHPLQAIATTSTTLSKQPCVKPHPIPNKHLPACPAGSAIDKTETPLNSLRQLEVAPQRSLLFPPDKFNRVDFEHASIFEINAAGVANALEFASHQPLPPPDSVFPWLHGLHPQNHAQQAFFNGRRRITQRSPSCLRAITLVKAEGNLNASRLKGAIAAEEFMQLGPLPHFTDPDPLDGFSVRNFHIQPAKIALTSDIIVYGENLSEVRKVAWDIAAAQQRWREIQSAKAEDFPDYNTFICISPFSEFEQNHSHLISLDSLGSSTGRVLDLASQEREEMFNMTTASEISPNVYLGPSPEPGSAEERWFDVLIECSDVGRLNPAALQVIAYRCDQSLLPSHHDFPSSGSLLPPNWSDAEADGILDTCKWIYHISHGSLPLDHTTMAESLGPQGNSQRPSAHTKAQPRRVLIHCPDGYTESTMLGIAYYSYSTGRSIPEAWLSLHTTERRNFFAYPSDVSLLSAISQRLVCESPISTGHDLEGITNILKNEPKWFCGLDGSFPSRILDYLYLGNLVHANNPDLLRELNICQVLSVGETASWPEGYLEKWGLENVYVVQGVQDNGIDPLTDEFDRCLQFIEQGRKKGTATLVHCRVGVSRSATICIAEVMRALNYSFPRAYCYVRARRLNVIVQPHLRFVYELLLREELVQTSGASNATIKREMEWAEVTREIALMNRPYSR